MWDAKVVEQQVRWLQNVRMFRALFLRSHEVNQTEEKHGQEDRILNVRRREESEGQHEKDASDGRLHDRREPRRRGRDRGGARQKEADDTDDQRRADFRGKLRVVDVFVRGDTKAADGS